MIFSGSPFKITPNPALIEFHTFLKWELEGKAQSVEEVLVVRRTAVAVSYTAVHGVVVPATAPNHTARARRRTLRVGRRTTGVIVLTIPVTAPLHHIARHVVDAKFIWLLCLHVVSLYFCYFIFFCVKPPYIFEIIATTIFVAPALIPTAGCILPLSLRGQTETLTGQAIQLIDELLAVIP